MINNVKGLKLISLLTGENSEERRFVIPEYQRDYKWGKEQISQFITDIFEAYDDSRDNKSDSYFFGAVITEKQEQLSNEGFTEYHLIDGQQRITTSILFIKLLESLYQNEIDHNTILKNSSVLNTITKFRNMLWSDSIPENKNCKLVSLKQEDSSLLKNILTDSDNNNNKENIFYKNYTLLQKEYHDHFKARDNFQLVDFIKFCFDHLEFVQVDTNSREAALKIFSVLNTRGLDLDSTDIIKAEAMANLKNDPITYNEFSSKWKKLEKQANFLEISLETIFRYYINMYRPSSIKKTYNENIKEIWNTGSFKQDKLLALQDFEKFTQCLQDIWDMNDPYIWCLRHLLVLGKNAYTWIPVLVTMKYQEYSNQDICTIAKFIARWHWIHLVHGWTVEKIKSFGFSLIKAVNEKNSVEDILKIKPKIVSDSEYTEERLVNEFHSILKESDIYHNCKWGRPLLYFLHNLQILKHDNQEQAFKFKALTKNDTIEHIGPQNSSDKKWIQCSDNKKHMIGNLTILHSIKNSSVGTDFDKKSKEYEKVLYAFTPTLSKENLWSDKSIDTRSDELISILCKAIDIVL